MKIFLSYNPYIIKEIERTFNSPHTTNLVKKYFILHRNEEDKKHRIKKYNDCPVWVLLELLSFGSIIQFYLFYYESRKKEHIPKNILNLVRNLRNSAAHNNCILFDLNQNTTKAPLKIKELVLSFEDFSKSKMQSKLSSRPILEYVSLIYVYSKIVSGKARKHRLQELNLLLNDRMKQKKGFFKDNDLIKSNYDFVQKITKLILGI